jgi:hypothetical protein
MNINPQCLEAARRTQARLNRRYIIRRTFKVVTAAFLMLAIATLIVIILAIGEASQY